MDVVQRIAKNTGMLLGSMVINFALNFFYFIYAARYLGVNNFGILTFAIAFTGLFTAFTDLGLGELIVREVARKKSIVHKYLNNVLPMKLILSILTFLLLSIIINLLGYKGNIVKVVYLVSLSVIFDSLCQTFYSVFQAYEEMQYQSIGQVLIACFRIISITLVIVLRLDVVDLAFLYFITSAIILAYAFTIYKLRFVMPRFRADFSFWWKAIKESWPMGGMAFCGVLYFRIDTVMLSMIKGEIAVGLYNAAYKLLEMAIFIPLIVVTAVFPLLSKRYKNSAESYADILGKIVKYLIYFIIPIACIVTLVSKPMIGIIYGNMFLASANVLQILIWAAVLMYITIILMAAFRAINRQAFSFKLVVLTVIVNIVLNMVMIPRYSFIGAALTTVFSEVFLLCVGLVFLSKWGYKISVIGIFLSPPIIWLFIACAIAISLIRMHINIIVVSAVIIAVYTVLVYKVGFKEDDKQLMRNVFGLFGKNN